MPRAKHFSNYLMKYQNYMYVKMMQGTLCVCAV